MTALHVSGTKSNSPVASTTAAYPSDSVDPKAIGLVPRNYSPRCTSFVNLFKVLLQNLRFSAFEGRQIRLDQEPLGTQLPFQVERWFGGIQAGGDEKWNIMIQAA